MVWPEPAKNLSACSGLIVIGQAQALGLLQRRIGQAHGGHEARQSRARPRNVHGLRILDGRDSHRARGLQVFPALAGRLIVRLERPGNRCRAAGQINGDLAFQIQPRQIVVFFLGDLQAIADEYRARLRCSPEYRRAG